MTIFLMGVLEHPNGFSHCLAARGPNRWPGMVRNSIVSTMKSKDPPDKEKIEWIANYVRYLPPPPSLAEARGRMNRAIVAEGRRTFLRLGCTNCHRGPRFTSGKSYDVGLKDEQDRSRFNPPSLLGLSQRGPYFHDGRAESLDDVLNKFRHQVPPSVNGEELENLKQFLLSL